MEASGDDMAVDPRDVHDDEEGQGEGPADANGNGLVLQPDQVGESESPEFIPLIEILSQYVNYTPLLTSMRERLKSLAQEQMYVRDEDLMGSIKDQIANVQIEIARFEAKGENILKHLKGMTLDWSGGKVSVVDAMLTAEALNNDASAVATLAEQLSKDRKLSQIGRQKVLDALMAEAKDKERQVLELTTLLIGTQVHKDDYTQLLFLWAPSQVGTKVRLTWDVVTQRWVLPANLKPIRRFVDLIAQLSRMHAANGRDGDVLDVEAWPGVDGKWTFKTRVQTVGGIYQCSS